MNQDFHNYSIKSFIHLMIISLILTRNLLQVTSSPCGICGVDVICKSQYPVCSKNQVITLDYCGCCLVCKNILEKDESCSVDIETLFVCQQGLQCVNGKCISIKQ